MKHKWIQPVDEYQTCSRCGMQRRMVTRACPGINPMRHSYRVWEYKRQPGSRWFWVRTREPTPACEESTNTVPFDTEGVAYNTAEMIRNERG